MTTRNAADFLSLEGVGKSFNGHQAVDDVDLRVAAGESVSFLGPSGCGKTTLLRLIAGLEMPDSGRITRDGDDITNLAPKDRRFGMVFQSYSLFPHLTVGKNVAYGLACRKWRRDQIRERVMEMLDLVQLADQVDKLPNQLSGGQQQRVAIARALASNPHVLLLDEPFSALDAKVRTQLRDDMRELQSRLGFTSILVTHDQEEAMAVADRIVVMNQGRIEQVGNGHDLYHHPRTAFVANFVGDINLLKVEPVSDGLLSLNGRPLVLGEEALPSHAQIGIRPEAIALAPESDAENRFVGTVVRSRFLGKRRRLDLELGGQSISLELHGHHGGDISPGHELAVSLPSDAIRLINEH